MPGDICMIKAGDQVPADMRIFEAVNLQVLEAMLTGTSTFVLALALMPVLAFCFSQIMECAPRLVPSSCVMRASGPCSCTASVLRWCENQVISCQDYLRTKLHRGAQPVKRPHQSSSGEGLSHAASHICVYKFSSSEQHAVTQECLRTCSSQWFASNKLCCGDWQCPSSRNMCLGCLHIS